jgi:hypothetical protein
MLTVIEQAASIKSSLQLMIQMKKKHYNNLQSILRYNLFTNVIKMCQAGRLGFRDLMV